MKVSIIGTGYVGLTTGACLAFLGHKVTCIDSDEKKIALLQAGKTPIYEPFLDRTDGGGASKSSVLSPITPARCPDADVIFIAVGTPPSPDGSPDLHYLSRPRAGNRRSTMTAISWWW